MSFFRRRTDLEAMRARPAREVDRVTLARFVYSAGHRFVTTSVEETPALFVSDPTTVLEHNGRIVGALGFGWATPPVSWLRTLLLERELAVASALEKLSAPMFERLAQDGIRLAAITLDEWSDPWLRSPLTQLGYRPMVEVVGYEKHSFDRPAAGNQVVALRPAQLTDLEAVLALDAACFPLPWVKGAEIIGPALQSSPCFLIAEWSDTPIGYAFVTAHQGGSLLHLVRIAVSQEFRGAGVGARLLAGIVDYAAAHDADLLTLNTQSDNAPAQRLYEWFGFRRNGEKQTVLGLELAR